MHRKKEPDMIGQIYTARLMDLLNGRENSFSSEDIAGIIEELSGVKRRKEADETRKRHQEERERQEREAREEQERKAAHIREVTSMNLPLDWKNVFDQDARAQGVHADSISDGLILCLSNLGKVDIEYISSITGADYKTVIGALKGSIYQNPETWGECFYRGRETSEEYLSGNLMRKWKAARAADQEYCGYFADNVRAIENVLPPAVAAENIYVTPGSPWVPADMIDDFILYLFGDWHRWSSDEEVFRTKYDELTVTWEIPYKNRYSRNDVRVSRTYGTERINALQILERTQNMRSVSVTKEVICRANASGFKRLIDQSETALAIEKQKKMIETFREWIWEDARRKERLETIFENNFGCVRRRIFDGSFLTFPDMSPEVSLYPYQKNAVARILFTPNTLLAHDVGSGKTYVMIAAGMELRRMGLSRKNVFVVPNNIVGQWKSLFCAMYPNAKLLCVEPKSFTPARREAVLERIRDEDFDGIIIAYSCFEQIPLSKEYYRRQLLAEQRQLAEVAWQRNRTTSQLRKKEAAVIKALAELSASIINDLYDGVYFDELGITRLFVDEAHNFKNVPIETKADKVLGINAAGSKKCQNMMDKVHMVKSQNGGAGVVFATGTPITKSITDAFILQKYLQSGELALLDLQSFDSWVGMFAERSTEFEIDVDTGSYRLATRFSRFHNLPELASLLFSVADLHQADTTADIPQMDGYTDALVSKTDALADYLKSISQRAEDVRCGSVNRRDDNMPKITTDGRKAALDLRLVDPGAAFTYQSKVARCVENVTELYFKTSVSKSVQLIFCDTSTQKRGFNIYDEVRSLLINRGIPADRIAFIHDAETEKQRNALFARVRNGDIRILLGSTFKLGLGVNVQDRLIALHHLDVPRRPADMTQREGRILRQGNTNPKVQIFHYITEGSFDAYSWQLLETKQRYITGLLPGSLGERSGSDIEDAVLDYAEVKALAVGDPLVKERVETENELSRCLALQRKFVDSKLRMEKELLALPGRMSELEKRIRDCENDLTTYIAWKRDHPAPEDSMAKKAEAERRKQIRERLYASLRGHILEAKEKLLMTYRGFDIILPANMTIEKQYIWLIRNGRYYVELGDTAAGNLIRIDHCLENLQTLLDKLKTDLAKLRKQECQLAEELRKEESFSEEIEKCRKKLAEIDRKLGGGQDMSDIKMTSIPSMNVGKLAEKLSNVYCSIIRNGYPIRTVPSVMLWGAPGVGKSQAVRQIADEIGSRTGKKVVVTDVRLLLFNPIDLRGIPTANADKTLAVWLKPQIFQMDAGDDTVNILFLDEISADPQSVQAAAYQITLDRTVGEHKLPENCIVIAAGNRMTDRSVAFKMPKALANRMMHVEIVGSFHAWKEWSIRSSIHAKVLGFLSFKQDHLMGFDPGSGDLAFATPRSWEMVSNLLNCVGDDIDEMYPLIAGIVGSGVAVEFRTWAKVYRDLPSIEEVFDGKTSQIPAGTDALYALTAAMTAYARAHRNEMGRIANSIRYANQMPPDFSVILMKAYMHLDRNYKETLILMSPLICFSLPQNGFS